MQDQIMPRHISTLIDALPRLSEAFSGVFPAMPVEAIIKAINSAMEVKCPTE